jgi:3-oxoacyl-[acyl-carrier protein] reductase
MGMHLAPRRTFVTETSQGPGSPTTRWRPGPILTDAVGEPLRRVASSHRWGESWDDIERAAVDTWVPNDIGRFGHPKEIASSVVFLGSPHADYICGAT